MTDLIPPADRGVLTQVEDGWELRFERRLRHPPERVWAALTTGDGLAGWLAEAEIDLEPGGRMDLYFRQPDHEFMPDVPERRRQSNRVVTVRPPTLFEHTFGGDARSVASWRLAPDGDGTHLTLVHRIPADWAGSRQNVLSGWHHHMEGLDDAARGRRHAWDWDRWFALRDAYGAGIAARDAAEALFDRLVGEWTFEGRVLAADGPVRHGTETVVRRGAWLVIESSDGARFQLNFDPAAGRVVGDFVAWDHPGLWTYEGAAEGDRLTLATRGPSMDDAAVQTDYQDVWEVRSNDERILTGRLVGADGQWRDFVVTTYRRKDTTA